jgi:putative ABC transport system ATP-binding protein
LTLLEFQNVTYTQENNNILKNIFTEIDQGDFISVIGPSGSGKSTFLKLCCHLISSSSGRVIYNGKEITEYNPIELRKSISYCFQMPSLFGDKVEDNMNFVYSIRNQKLNLERVYELFSLFKLDKEYLKRDIIKLSGGEKQRIALIRNLLFKPKILLLDEVTSALDVENTLIVEEVIQKLNKEGITILWITHNLEQSRRHANKILKFENGEIKEEEVIKSCTMA